MISHIYVCICRYVPNICHVAKIHFESDEEEELRKLSQYHNKSLEGSFTVAIRYFGDYLGAHEGRVFVHTMYSETMVLLLLVVSVMMMILAIIITNIDSGLTLTIPNRRLFVHTYIQIYNK